MWRRSRFSVALATVCITAVLIVVAPDLITAGAQTADVTATVESDPMPSSGDAADDPAIWVHPDDPSLSTIIATDKEGGLVVYDLDGRQLQYVPGGRPNNVDIRHGFPLGGQTVDLVVSSDRDDDAVTFHRVDRNTRNLVAVGTPLDAGIDVYGICMYHSPVTDDFYVFVTSNDGGPVRQWRLSDDGSGGIAAEQVREFTVETTAEGCVADDELSFFYMAEETVAIWKYEAEPNGGLSRVEVDGVGPRLDGDVEGLAIYYGEGTSGYLIASSQGSSEFVVYERGGDNAHVTTFRIADSSAVDGTTNTDGIDVTGTPLGPAFPSGVFVAQDGDNDSGNQNFKLVPWENVANSTNPSLLIQNRDSRGSSPGSIPRDPIPEEPSADTWTEAQAVVTDDADDGETTGSGSTTRGEALVMEAGRQILLRFTDLDLPPDALVRRAHIQFTAAGGDTPVLLSIHGLAGTGGQVETSVVTWAPAVWTDPGERGPFQQTPDLSRIVQEVIDTDGWQPGGDLTFVIGAGGEGGRTAISHEGSPDQAPSLRLEFTADG
jgi:3-phytase